jgi:hypothetical protein
LFKAFNLQLANIEAYNNPDSEYPNIMRSQHDLITNKINQFMRPDGFFDGAMMRSDWFPDIEGKIDVFISHAHKDEKSAIALATFLYDNFSLVSFIDSLVWKNSISLLKLIDDEFCKNEDRCTYDYTLRNQSTSHVHMMLSVALTEMIDKSECLFFLNTPESITPYDSVQDGTISPWIFAEISMTKLIRIKLPNDHRSQPILEKYATDSVVKSFVQVVHDLPTNHLIPISYDDICSWHKIYSTGNIPALTALYKLKEIEYE